MAAPQHDVKSRAAGKDNITAFGGAKPHVVEPELLKPAPRSVELHTSAKATRWILLALVVTLPALCIFFAMRNQGNWEAVRKRGVEVNAVLIKTFPRKYGKNSHGPQATYGFMVNGKQHTIGGSLTDDEYHMARIGVDSKRVKYLPEDPDVVYYKDRLADGGETNHSATICWGLAVASVMVVGGFWVHAERIRARRVALAESGIPVATHFLSFAPATEKDGEKIWKIDYRFKYNGETFESSESMHADAIEPLLASPTGLQSALTATVLCDPTNPKRHELYFGVRQSVKSVAA